MRQNFTFDQSNPSKFILDFFCYEFCSSYVSDVSYV